jgi:hypothetical protein
MLIAAEEARSKAFAERRSAPLSRIGLPGLAYFVSQSHAALVNPNTSSRPRVLVESVGSIEPR